MLLGMAAISLALAIWLARGTHAFTADVERASGRVVGYRQTQEAGGGGSLFTPRLVFVAADGRSHEFAGQLSAGARRFATGAEVPVIYSASNPADARIDLFLDNWLGPAASFLLFILAATAGTVLVRSSRNMR